MFKRILRKMGFLKSTAHQWTAEDRERAGRVRAERNEIREKRAKKQLELDERKMDLKMRELDFEEKKLRAKERDLDLDDEDDDDDYDDEDDDEDPEDILMKDLVKKVMTNAQRNRSDKAGAGEIRHNGADAQGTERKAGDLAGDDPFSADAGR